MYEDRFGTPYTFTQTNFFKNKCCFCCCCCYNIIKIKFNSNISESKSEINGCVYVTKYICIHDWLADWYVSTNVQFVSHSLTNDSQSQKWKMIHMTLHTTFAHSHSHITHTNTLSHTLYKCYKIDNSKMMMI